MRKLFLIFLTGVFFYASSLGQNIKIHPTPQTVRINGKTADLGKEKPTTFTVSGIKVTGRQQADSLSVKLLDQLFRTDSKKGYPVYIGEKGDKAIKKHDKMIPQTSGGYYLSVTPERTVIAGSDENGTFYALQTLKQLIQNNRLPDIEIIDFPNVAYRGTVEGFYGQPWSHQDRISQLKFYGDNKLNTYIYGPKDDPYHSCPNWRKPYPANEAKQISELTGIAKANKVDFVWAIHPGQDIKWNDEDRDLLLKKFEMMYELGVRSFAVFFDDISGEGTDPVKQAELLNYLHDHFIVPKKDCSQLVICPTEYNKSWANPKTGSYLDILGEKLHPSIQIMWTGDKVMSDITVEGLQYINERIKRPAYIWWNFPVSDYVRAHLLMGSAYGLDNGATNLMSGFVSNPMDKAEASKIAIYSIADYGWNTGNYNAQEEWEDAVRYILPQNAEAFRVFASHNSDPGANGHGFRREESVAIKPVVDKFLSAKQYSEGDYAPIYKEFEQIKAAAAQLLNSNENPALIKELKPWLEQFQLLGTSGIAALDLYRQTGTNIQDRWNDYLGFLKLKGKQEGINKTYNQNPYQPGASTGTLVMQPLVDHLVKEAEKNILQSVSSANTSETTPSVPVLNTNVEQFKRLAIQSTDESFFITPVLEVVRISPGQYIGMELPAAVTSCMLELDMNNGKIKQWGKLEISQDGQNWTALEPEIRESSTLLAKINDKAVKGVRLVNADTTTRPMRLQQFRITSGQFSGKSGNVLRALDSDLSTSFLLTGSKIINKPGHSGKVALFTSPAKGKFTISAIDRKGKKHLVADNLQATYNIINLKNIPEFASIELYSEKPLDIHEIVWVTD